MLNYSVYKKTIYIFGVIPAANTVRKYIYVIEI